jgi:hypothetical protein
MRETRPSTKAARLMTKAATSTWGT